MKHTRNRSFLSFFVLTTVLIGHTFSQPSVADTSGYPEFLHREQNIIRDDSVTLTSFWEKLYLLQQEKSEKVRILHIGDSHLQGGTLGGKLTADLQHAFPKGNGGRGLLFPYKLAHSNNPTHYKVSYTGSWQGCRNVFRNKRCKECGISGITATTTDRKASFTITTDSLYGILHTFDQIRIYLPKASRQAYKITAKNTSIIKQSWNDFGFVTLDLKDRVNKITIDLEKVAGSKDPFILQGVSLENDDPGIEYSTIGVNGAKASDYLAGKHFSKQLRSLQPDLIILSLGTNDAYAGDFNATTFHEEYEALVALIRKHHPEVPVLLTTPGDCLRNYKYPNKNNLIVRKEILSIADRYTCATWDWFEVMGGMESIESWYKHGLASKDRVHLRSAGYEVQASLLFEAIITAYAKHQKAKADSSPPGIIRLLKDLFVFDKEAPVFFTHAVFWVLFIAFFALYTLVYKHNKRRNIFLLIISLFFYYKAGGLFFFLLIFSAVSDFFLGNLIHQSHRKFTRKLLLALSIFINLGLLGYFKYSGLFIGWINDLFHTHFPVTDLLAAGSNALFNTNYDTASIILPIGISFYTFQTISYTVDLYRKRIIPVKSFFDFAFYVSFFPQLVAGPIVRANEFLPQLYRPYKLSKADFSRAIYLILLGLVKKIVISDFIAGNFIDRVFESPLKYAGVENLLAVYGYTIQIFCDFSGYTDIAIGIALLLGFSLPLNFNRPYLASNITDFWRRWHISLSSWLKDYLYIPLGGNRKGRIRTYINLLITMLLGGLWHGPFLRFILWGGLHGLALALHKLRLEVFGPPKNTKFSPVLKLGGMLLTFHFVAFCWILFRAESLLNFRQLLSQILFAFHPEMILDVVSGYSNVMIVMLLGYLLHFMPVRGEEFLVKRFSKLKLVPMGVLVSAVILLIYQFKMAGIQPFIYFRF